MTSPRQASGMVGASAVQLAVDSQRPLAELTAQINAVCVGAESQPDRTVLVISLGAVSSGARAWPEAAVTITEVSRWERAVRRLERLASATVAVAQGICGGPSLDLLLATDYRIASPDLRLLLPVNDGQFWPGMAVHRLVNQIGAARARQLVLWGFEITSAHAAELGLIDEVTQDVNTAAQAAHMLLGRVAGPDLAIRRQLLLEASGSSHEQALGVHLAACDRELRRLADRTVEPDDDGRSSSP